MANFYFVFMCLAQLFVFMCIAQRVIPILRRMREQHETDSEDEEDFASDDADDARQYFYFNLVHIAPCL